MAARDTRTRSICGIQVLMWSLACIAAASRGKKRKLPLAESMEIGNEPGNYSDAQYRALFENMARGLRKGDPKLKVATCATK